MTFDPAETRRICEAATPGPCEVSQAEPGPLVVHPKGQFFQAFARFSDRANAEFDAHARTALPDACDVIKALCEMLNDDYKSRNYRLGHPPDWPTVALAWQQAMRRLTSEIDEILEEKP